MAMTDASTGAALSTPQAVALGQDKLSWMVFGILLGLMIPLNMFAGPLVLTTQRLVLMAAFFPALMMLMRGDAGKIRFFDVFAFIYVIWSTLAIAVNNPANVVQYSGSTSLEFLCGYLIGRVCIRNIHQFRRFSRVFAILVLISLPFALIETQTGQPMILMIFNQLPVVFSSRAIDSMPRLGLHRVQFVMPTPIHYGLFAAIGMCLVAVTHQTVWTQSKRLVWGGLIGFASFLSLSAGAFLAVVFQLMFLIWATLTRGNASRWWIMFGIAFVFWAVIEVLSDRSAIMVFLSYATFSPATAFNRTIIFEFGMQNVYANPIFGIGLNDWERPFWLFHSSVDNFWLLIAMRMGFPGILIMWVMWFGVIWLVAKKNFTEGSELYFARRGWMFMIVGLSFTLATVDVWGPMHSLVFFLLGIGVWLIDVEEDDGAGAGAAVEDHTTKRGRRAKPGHAARPGKSTAASRQAQKKNRGTPTYTRFERGVETAAPTTKGTTRPGKSRRRPEGEPRKPN